jgi:secreted trypsin-like serine protease
MKLFRKVALTVQVILSTGSAAHALQSDSGTGFIGGDNGDSSAIMGGIPAAAGAYPFYTATLGPNMFCGGALIHPDVVLSAAHCYSAWAVGLDVCVGATSRDPSLCSSKPDGPQEVIAVQQIYVHPDYSPNTFGRNDLMLIKLAVPSTMTTLAQLNANHSVPSEESVVKAIGLGRTDGKALPSTLLEVDVTVGDPDTCNRVFYDFDVDYVLCTFGNGIAGVCLGDS